jgi:PDZ domain
MPNPCVTASRASVRLLCALVLAVTWTGAHGAGPRQAAGATPHTGAAMHPVGEPAEQRMRRDMQSMLSHMAETGALGPNPGHVSLRVDEPPRRIASLGALVNSTDARSARDGLHVLGTTPGSLADALGLQPGDVITTVNGTSLRGLGADDRGRALAAATLRSVVDALPDASTLSIEVERGRDALTLSAPMQAVYVPAMHVEIGDAPSGGGPTDAAPVGTGEDSCGRISMFDVAPRGQRLYAARILLLDGSTPGPEGTASFRVAPGEHRLLVAENIPTRALGIGEIATRRRETSKPLTVTVRPGRTALVAAQLHLGNVTDLSHGSYWDPVVWKEIAEPCR